MHGKVIFYDGHYSVALCRRHPDKIFVFGDNMIGKGKGGQAIIRDELNTFGVPTKRLPSNKPGSFFRDRCQQDIDGVERALTELKGILDSGKTVVVPTTKEKDISLGLGLAQLNTKAPHLYGHMCILIDAMALGRVAFASEGDL